MGMLSLNSGKEGCERKYSFQVDGLDRVDGMVAGLVNVKKKFSSVLLGTTNRVRPDL